MKVILSVALAAALLAGCSERSSESAQPSREADAAAPSAPAKAPSASSSVAGTAQRAVQAVEDTAGKAQAMAEEATQKAQALLDQTRTLLSEKKLVEAGGLLDQLGALTLDEDQQKMLTDLKEELQKAAGEVGAGLGELKTLVTEQKYSEATALVSKLTDYELSPDQQKVFDDLKAQLQKLIGSQAGQEGAKAVQNLLGR